MSTAAVSDGSVCQVVWILVASKHEGLPWQTARPSKGSRTSYGTEQRVWHPRACLQSSLPHRLPDAVSILIKGIDLTKAIQGPADRELQVAA